MEKITKTEQKYLDMLFDIEQRCKNNELFTIREISSKYKVQRGFSKVMMKNGIMKDVGYPNNPKYIWTSIRPNIKMIRAILKEIRSNKKSYMEIKNNKSSYASKLSETTIENIIYLRDVKKKTFSEISKEVKYSNVHTANIYYAAKGSEIHLKRMGHMSKKAVMQYRKKIKVSYRDKPIETVRVKPRMHPQVVQEKKQRSIVILWGLINIKF